MNREQVPVIIPSLEPDGRLITLLENLQRKNISNIIIINDGSNQEYDDIFNTAKGKFGCTIIKHYSNLGKGRALKNVFSYCLYTFPELDVLL